jgi:signal recognition particle receptor subunit beta
MGMAQSTECADEQGTYNLSDQDAVNDVNIVRRLIENGEPAAVSEFIDERLNRWTQERVKLAIAGRCATGKSTFINTIRNVKPGDAGFAKSGSGNTTLIPTIYLDSINDKIAYYDLPGYSSIKFPKENYISEMKISDYDFFFVFFDGVLGENDVWLVRELCKLRKPFSLVRSKVDVDIANAEQDNKDPEMIIPGIKKEIEDALKAIPELSETQGHFLISSRNSELGEMSELLSYVIEHIGGIKGQVLLYSFGSITKEIVVRKNKMLKKRLVLATAIATGIASFPVAGAFVSYNTGLLEYEVRHYMSVFGINAKRVYSLTNFDHSLLNCRTLLEANLDMKDFVATKIGTYAQLVIAQSVIDLIFPLFGSAISAATVGVVTYRFLDDMLQDIYHDAVVIYDHILKTNGDHRM